MSDWEELLEDRSEGEPDREDYEETGKEIVRRGEDTDQLWELYKHFAESIGQAEMATERPKDYDIGDFLQDVRGTRSYD